MFFRLFGSDTTDSNSRSIPTQRIVLAAGMVVAAVLLVLAITRPTLAAVVPQRPVAQDDMMGQEMMGQGMMGSSQSISPTMSMAEMAAMMSSMSAMMAAMPMSGTMPMGDMGHMMQMMGMMHQHMGQMQMMMGGMMAGDMMDMDDMPCMGDSPAAAAPLDPAAEANDTGSETITPTIEATTASAVHPPLVADPVHQSAEAGAVTVEVFPLPPTDPLEVAFEVVLDTHSVELGFDLAERATLTIGDAEFTGSAWEPNTPGGHHVTGILRFAIDEAAHEALADVNVVTLRLSNIDGDDVSFVYTVGEHTVAEE